MKIKAGFAGKETQIRISARGDSDRTAELWIEQIGLKDETTQRYETLAYITLDELLDLQAEIKKAIAKIVA